MPLSKDPEKRKEKEKIREAKLKVLQKGEEGKGGERKINDFLLKP